VCPAKAISLCFALLSRLDGGFPLAFVEMGSSAAGAL